MSIPDQNQLQQPQNPSTYQQVRPLDFYALGKMSNPPKSNELYDSHTSYPGQSLDLLHRNYFSIRNQNYDIYRDNYKKLATLKDKIESDAKISYQKFQHPTNLQNKETYNLTKERLFATDRYSTIRPGQNISKSDFINQKSNILHENKPQISKWENPNETGDTQSKLLKDNRLVFVGSNIPKVEFEMPDANSRTKVSNDAPEWFDICPDWKIKNKKGMFVDIVANGSIHKGMPHKFYHGRTGRVFDISPNSIGVIVNKQVRNRIVHKRIHVRVEHLRISTCNANFKKHVKALEEEKRKNPKDKKLRKRLPVGPQEEQKIIVNEKSVVKFYNPDFRREIF